MPSVLPSLRDVHASFPRMAAIPDIKDFFSEIDLDLINYGSNTFSQTIARRSLLMLTVAKLYGQRTCFSVVCARLDGNDGIEIGLLQQTITWYMVAGKLIIIPALGHQNKGKSSFTGSERIE